METMAAIFPFRGYRYSREEIADRAGTLFDALTRANLDVAIDGKFPLANAAEAQLILEERKTTGKLVLEVDVSLDS